MYLLVSSIAAVAVLYKLLKFPKQDIEKISKLFYRDNKPVIFAHRAGQNEAPENTLAAIDTAYKNGATAVEIDLDFTKDAVPIIFHDDMVDRLTNGTGAVSSYNYEDLKKLNAVAKFPYKIIGKEKIDVEFEYIPTLSEAVKLCMKHGLTIDLDIKSNATKTADALKSLLKEYPDAPDFIFLSSFYPHYIFTLRKECPEFQAGIIWRHYYLEKTITGESRYNWYITPFMQLADSILKYLIHNWLYDFLGISVVVMKKDHLSYHYVQQWKNKGVEVVAWTVNSPLEKLYMMEYLNIPIITDSVLNEICEEQTT